MLSPFQAGETTFLAHKWILSAQSPVMRELFAEKSTNELESNEFAAEAVETVIRYCYQGHIDHATMSEQLVEATFLVATDYGMDELREEVRAGFSPELATKYPEDTMQVGWAGLAGLGAYCLMSGNPFRSVSVPSSAPTRLSSARRSGRWARGGSSWPRSWRRASPAWRRGPTDHERAWWPGAIGTSPCSATTRPPSTAGSRWVWLGGVGVFLR
jgi:BTB/POZ domain